MGGAYYVKQEGIPFIGQQESFSNVNNANNTDGITDGISNPLDNIDNDDNDSSSNSDGGDGQIGIPAVAQSTVVPVDDVVVNVPISTEQTSGFDFDFGATGSQQPPVVETKKDENLFSVPLGDSTTSGSLI